jgi:L-lactate utilization protein LutB
MRPYCHLFDYLSVVKEISACMDEKIKKAIFNLQRNNMKGFYVESVQELLFLLSTLLACGERIGCGDSVTLEETGVFEYLRNGEFTFYDKHQSNLTSEEKKILYLKNFDSDTFITGTNAITMDGKLFNIDGNGSRVAPMIYGPKQVIVVVGTNKLVDTVEDAIYRARQIAAPLDAKRLHKNTPCVKLGKCIDCKHEQRICNDFVLISGQFLKDRIKVIFINGNYGY